MSDDKKFLYIEKVTVDGKEGFQVEVHNLTTFDIFQIIHELKQALAKETGGGLEKIMEEFFKHLKKMRAQGEPAPADAPTPSSSSTPPS